MKGVNIIGERKDKHFEFLWGHFLMKKDRFDIISPEAVLFFISLIFVKFWGRNKRVLIFLSCLFPLFFCVFFVNKIDRLVEVNSELNTTNQQIKMVNVRVEEMAQRLDELYPSIGEGFREVLKIIKEDEDVDEQKLMSPLTKSWLDLLVRLHGIQKYKLRFPDEMIFPIDDIHTYVGCPEGEFGWRRLKMDKWKRTFHHGLDLDTPNSVFVKNSIKGNVFKVGKNKRYGKYVIVKSLINGWFYYSYYGHLAEILVKKGQGLCQGEQVGIMGETGQRCTGVHLHWGIYRYHRDLKGKLRVEWINPVVNSTWAKEVRLEKIY